MTVFRRWGPEPKLVFLWRKGVSVSPREAPPSLQALILGEGSAVDLSSDLEIKGVHVDLMYINREINYRSSLGCR